MINVAEICLNYVTLFHFQSKDKYIRYIGSLKMIVYGKRASKRFITSKCQTCAYMSHSASAHITNIQCVFFYM